MFQCRPVKFGLLYGVVIVGLLGCSEGRAPIANTEASTEAVRKSNATVEIARTVTPTPLYSSATASPLAKPVSFYKDLEEGKELYYRDDYRNAVTLFEKALSVSPDEPEILTRLFVCYKNLEQPSIKSKGYRLAKRLVSEMPGEPIANQAASYIKEAEAKKPEKDKSSKSRSSKESLVSSFLLKTHPSFAVLKFADFEEVRANTLTAEGEYAKGNLKDAARFLEQNISSLHINEDKWESRVADTMGASSDTDEWTVVANELRATKLIRAQTEIALGGIYIEMGRSADARKYFNLAAEDKGLGDAWFGRSYASEARSQALAQLRDL